MTTLARAKTFKALVFPKQTLMTDSSLREVGKFKGQPSTIVNTIEDKGKTFKVTFKSKAKKAIYVSKGNRTFSFFEGKTPRSLKQVA